MAEEAFDEQQQPEETAQGNVEQDLEMLRRELDDAEARVLRVTADYQNFVRRAGQQAAAAADQQLADVAKALLTVLDHFDHALEVDPQATSAESMLEGVRMVHSELLQSLERFGIKRVDANPGDEFDPNRHEAMMRQKVEGLEPNHVAAQFQPGYIMTTTTGGGERTLRPAKVAVTE